MRDAPGQGFVIWASSTIGPVTPKDRQHWSGVADADTDSNSVRSTSAIRRRFRDIDVGERLDHVATRWEPRLRVLGERAADDRLIFQRQGSQVRWTVQVLLGKLEHTATSERTNTRQHLLVDDRECVLVGVQAHFPGKQFRSGVRGAQPDHARAGSLGYLTHQAEVTDLEAASHQE